MDDQFNRSGIPVEIEENGTKYQQYTIRARRVLQQKYKVLENIMKIKTYFQQDPDPRETEPSE